MAAGAIHVYKVLSPWMFLGPAALAAVYVQTDAHFWQIMSLNKGINGVPLLPFMG